MVLAGELGRREAVSRPVLENALLALTDQQYLSSGDGKLSLSPSFATSDTVKAIEARIRSLVPEDVTSPLSGEDPRA
jgi:glycerol-3-phosphate O-acyltransferase